MKKLVPQGVSAVFDGVGKDTFVASLECIRPFGMAVNYGNASGHVPPLDLLLLAKRSLSVSRPGLSTYIRDTETMRTAAVELFELVMRGVLKVEIGQTYALKDAAAAHRDIEARKSTGSLLLAALRRAGLSRHVQTSTLAESAFFSMKLRRGSTSSPIRSPNRLLASSTSLIVTFISERALTSSVVSQSCSGFISPRPL